MKSIHSLAAKAIREELKKAFPAVKFSVKSDSFAGGNAVYITWKDGATGQAVDEIVSKYQYGHFDGMTDCYNYTNVKKDIPQVKYVQTRREVSEEIYKTIFDEAKKTYYGWELLESLDHNCKNLMSNWSVWTARDYIHRIVSKIDLTNCSGIEALNQYNARTF